MRKPNEIGRGGVGGRAERTPAVGKPLTSGAGWVWTSALSLTGHRLSLHCFHTHMCQQHKFLCQALLCQHLGQQDSFLQDVQGEKGKSISQGKSKLTKHPSSSTCHSAELLHQTITWFPYFAIALSLFPQGSQVSIGNSAVESWFCQRSNSRPLRQESSTVSPVGRSRWIESQPALQNYLNLNAPLLWLCKGHIKSWNI